MGKRVVKNSPSPRLMETIGTTYQKPAMEILCMEFVSFEKLRSEVISLDGTIDIPFIIGELMPMA